MSYWPSIDTQLTGCFLHIALESVATSADNQLSVGQLLVIMSILSWSLVSTSCKLRSVFHPTSVAHTEHGYTKYVSQTEDRLWRKDGSLQTEQTEYG